MTLFIIQINITERSLVLAAGNIRISSRLWSSCYTYWTDGQRVWRAINSTTTTTVQGTWRRRNAGSALSWRQPSSCLCLPMTYRISWPSGSWPKGQRAAETAPDTCCLCWPDCWLYSWSWSCTRSRSRDSAASRTHRYVTSVVMVR